jgi:hypothetical protein
MGSGKTAMDEVDGTETVTPVFCSIADSVGEFGRPYATGASLANRETLVVPCGLPASQAARRERFIAAAVITC